MSGSSRARTRWLIVVAFAIAMAWVESASVYYLRVLVDRVNPYQPNPLPVQGVIGQVELVRELATLVMLLTVGMLAGRTKAAQAGYAAIAFGVWDISYYVFLRVMDVWPKSLLDWDILFLLPLPWWGPVIAPVCIAVFMIVGGTLVTQFPIAPLTPTAKVLWRAQAVGIALALYVFMADSLRTVFQGLDVRAAGLPQTFNWWLFSLAFALMAAPVVHSFWRIRPHHRKSVVLRLSEEPPAAHQ